MTDFTPPPAGPDEPQYPTGAEAWPAYQPLPPAAYPPPPYPPSGQPQLPYLHDAPWPDPWAASAAEAARAKRRRRTIVGVSVALVLVVAGAIAAFAITGNKDSSRLGAPEQFAGYERLHDATADRAESVMRSALQGTSIGDVAAVATYSRPDGGRMVAFAARTSDAGGGSDSERVHQILDVVIPQAQQKEQPQSAQGGEEICGSVSFGTIEETMCGWSDDRTTGVTVWVAPAPAFGSAARGTDQLRSVLNK